jgi:carbon-monoxide dehydrogenase medium subunit
MYPAPFEYHAPTSLGEAVSLLERYGDEAKLIAGGHSLLPLMKLRFAQPAHLVDLRKVPNLTGIREDGGAIVIGAMTTHAAVARSDLVRRRLPVLAEAAERIGDAQVRNMGTIGGSLAHADPGADLPAVMLALGAEMRAAGRDRPRTIRANEFFVDILTSALAPTEVLQEIRIPAPAARSGSAYEKHPHPASGYALVGVAAVVTLGDGDVVREARVAITGTGARPTRAVGVERALAGQRADEDAIARAAARASDGLELRGDLQGPPEYKANLVTVYTRRALARAVGRTRAA